MSWSLAVPANLSFLSFSGTVSIPFSECFDLNGVVGGVMVVPIPLQDAPTSVFFYSMYPVAALRHVIIILELSSLLSMLIFNDDFFLLDFPLHRGGVVLYTFLHEVHHHPISGHVKEMLTS